MKAFRNKEVYVVEHLGEKNPDKVVYYIEMTDKEKECLMFYEVTNEVNEDD